MGTTYISMGQIRQKDGVPLFAGTCRTEALATSGTSADTTMTANPGDVAKIQAPSTATNGVVVNSGAAATATVGLFIKAGDVDWLIPKTGDDLHVIEV